MSFVCRVSIASLLIVIINCPDIASQPTISTNNLASIVIADSSRRQAVTVLLHNVNGEHLGSGVLVAAPAGGRWIVSNRHVVAGEATICVVTAKGANQPALVLPEQKKSHQALDLALIWLPTSPPEEAVVAEITDQSNISEMLPMVVATGYPAELSSPAKGSQYSERSGLLVPLLKQPLQEGLDLAYTATVEKGMSGGGVFIGSALIGINSAHRDPLWPGQWKDFEGKEVEPVLHNKLHIVSLGLSTATIMGAIKMSQPPGDKEIQQLSTFNCRKIDHLETKGSRKDAHTSSLTEKTGN